MVAIIGFGAGQRDMRVGLRGLKIKCRRLSGILFFQPPCWNDRQFARWAERTRYGRNPFCRRPSLGEDYAGDLNSHYRRGHGIRIGQYHWSTTLMLFALPFSGKVLTVVKPDGYTIHKVVYERAAKYGVEVKTVSLGLFSSAEVDRLSRCHLVPHIEGASRSEHLREIERAIGESQNDNVGLIPREWLEFGNGMV